MSSRDAQINGALGRAVYCVGLALRRCVQGAAGGAPPQPAGILPPSNCEKVTRALNGGSNVATTVGWAGLLSMQCRDCVFSVFTVWVKTVPFSVFMPFCAVVHVLCVCCAALVRAELRLQARERLGGTQQ